MKWNRSSLPSPPWKKKKNSTQESTLFVLRYIASPSYNYDDWRIVRYWSLALRWTRHISQPVGAAPPHNKHQHTHARKKKKISRELWQCGRHWEAFTSLTSKNNNSKIVCFFIGKVLATFIVPHTDSKSLTRSLCKPSKEVRINVHVFQLDKTTKQWKMNCHFIHEKRKTINNGPRIQL
jgi:hypothetical protein